MSAKDKGVPFADVGLQNNKLEVYSSSLIPIFFISSDAFRL